MTSTPILPPAAPSNLTATRPGQAIALKWTDNSTNESSFSIQRAASANLTQNAQSFTAVANAVSYRDTTALSETTYYYRVVAVNASGSSGASSTASATMK